jgi:hypothetical protein
MFLGPKEVKTVEDVAEKYNGTIELVKVTYADGTTDTMAKKMYQAAVTEAATDLNTLRDNRLHPVVHEILDLLLSWGVDLQDVNFLTASVNLSINASMTAAGTKLWGKPETALSLIDVDKVLKDKVTLNDIGVPHA